MMLSAAGRGASSPRAGAIAANRCHTSSVTKGDHRVQQPQQRIQCMGQHALGRRPRRRVAQRDLTISR